MEEQAIILAIQKLMESGAFEKLDLPGAQAFIIYALLIVLAMLSFRVFVSNGWFKKGIERFFALEEQKVKHLSDLNDKVVNVQQLINKEHERLSDVMNMLSARRESDKWEEPASRCLQALEMEMEFDEIVFSIFTQRGEFPI